MNGNPEDVLQVIPSLAVSWLKLCKVIFCGKTIKVWMESDQVLWEIQI